MANNNNNNNSNNKNNNNANKNKNSNNKNNNNANKNNNKNNNSNKNNTKKKPAKKVVNSNNAKACFTNGEVMEVMTKLHINPEVVSLKEFHHAMNIENEHRNVTKGDPMVTGKIALAHIVEFPDYYVRLEEMEKEAKKYWKNRVRPQVLLEV